MTRRGFGTTRRLPSGRWQARFSAPDGSRLAAERTFATQRADLRPRTAELYEGLRRAVWSAPAPTTTEPERPGGTTRLPDLTSLPSAPWPAPNRPAHLANGLLANQGSGNRR